MVIDIQTKSLIKAAEEELIQHMLKIQLTRSSVLDGVALSTWADLRRLTCRGYSKIYVYMQKGGAVCESVANSGVITHWKVQPDVR